MSRRSRSRVTLSKIFEIAWSEHPNVAEMPAAFDVSNQCLPNNKPPIFNSAMNDTYYAPDCMHPSRSHDKPPTHVRNIPLHLLAFACICLPPFIPNNPVYPTPTYPINTSLPLTIQSPLPPTHITRSTHACPSHRIF